ncbi:2917_t:CDS:2, partial [Entrophospora sp. SA101]
SSIPTWQDIEKAIVNIVKAGVYYKKEKDGKFMQNYKKRYTELHQAEDPDIYILNNAKRIYPNEDKYISMKSQYQEWYKNEPKILQAVSKLSDLYYQLAKNHFATNEEIEEEAADVKIPSREKSSSSIFKISNVVPIGTAHLKREATSTTSGDILYNKKITMSFHRPHPKRISHEPVSNRELELEQVNQALRDELSNEVSINKSNEKYINEIERKYIRCVKEIKSLNKELEQLENASEEEKAELRAEISNLNKQLSYSKKEIRDKISHIDNIERQLQESEERVQNLRLRFKIISSRRSSPILYNSEEDTDMAHIDPFINITRGLNRLENHFTGGTPLINPANIIQGMYGTLNTIRANYQRIDQDLDDISNQRDARDAQITQLQQDVNYFRQQNTNLQNQINQLTLERNNSQNDLALMTTAYYNEREERQHWWRVAKQLEKGMQMRINTLLLDKLALNFKLRRCQRHGSISNQVSVINIPPVFSQLETDSHQLQNKLNSDNDSIRAEIKSMIKSELALVPTPPQSTQSTSQRHEGQLLRPSQMEPGKIYRDPHLRLNDQEWLRMDDATDRLSALAGPSYLQTFMDTISKGGMSELSINKAIAKGISQGIKAVHDNNVSSQHRCSNCYSLGHNSRKCPYPQKGTEKIER